MTKGEGFHISGCGLFADGAHVGVSTTSTQLGWGSAHIPVGFLPTYLLGMGSCSVVLLWGIGMVGVCVQTRSPCCRMSTHMGGTLAQPLSEGCWKQSAPCRGYWRERGRKCCAGREQTGKRKKTFSRWKGKEARNHGKCHRKCQHRKHQRQATNGIWAEPFIAGTLFPEECIAHPAHTHCMPGMPLTRSAGQLRPPCSASNAPHPASG